MGDIEFFTIAFTLACVLGPALGAMAFFLFAAWRWLRLRGFTFTIVAPSKH